MRRIPDYGNQPAAPPRPATLRRELNLDLSKALAHSRVNHAEKANRWAAKLVEELRKANILRGQQ
jgi:hypothetical protein